MNKLLSQQTVKKNHSSTFTLAELLDEVKKLRRKAQSNKTSRKLLETAREKWEEAGSYATQ